VEKSLIKINLPTVTIIFNIITKAQATGLFGCEAKTCPFFLTVLFVFGTRLPASGFYFYGNLMFDFEKFLNIV
jgi:hypothetical protein